MRIMTNTENEYEFLKHTTKQYISLTKRLNNLKRNQPWIFTGRTVTKAEAPILWPSDANNRLTEKDIEAGKDSGQEEKGMTEGGMVG